MYVINWELTLSSWAFVISLGSVVYTIWSTKLANRHATYNIKKSIRDTTLYIVKSFKDNLELSIIAEADDVYHFLNNRHYLKKDFRNEIEDIQNHAVAFIRNQNAMEFYQEQMIGLQNQFLEYKNPSANPDITINFDEHNRLIAQNLDEYNTSFNTLLGEQSVITNWFANDTDRQTLEEKFEKILDLSNF